MCCVSSECLSAKALPFRLSQGTPREQNSAESKCSQQDEAFVDPEVSMQLFHAYNKANAVQQINLVRKVSTKQPFHVSSGTGDMHVALIDCGVKENILRSLVGRGRIMEPNVQPFVEGV